MEEIIKAIREAEERAAQMKEEALRRVTEIGLIAESEASLRKKETEETCKKMREDGIRAAWAKAEADYARSIEESRASARDFADERMNKTEQEANDIVGRLCGGDC